MSARETASSMPRLNLGGSAAVLDIGGGASALVISSDATLKVLEVFLGARDPTRETTQV